MESNGLRNPVSSTLTELITQQRSSSTALIDGGRRISYGELDEASRRLASGLAAHGIGAGDRVGALLANVPAWPELLFACARIGAIAVAINTRFGSAEVEDIAGRSRCKALVLGRASKGVEFEEIVAGVNPENLSAVELLISHESPVRPPRAPLPGRKTIAYEELLQHPPMVADHAGPETPCCIFTTSGTTSLPKFVLHKQSALVTHARAAARAFGYQDAATVTLQATPFCGIYGFSQALATLAAGRPIVLLHAFDAAEAVRLSEVHRVTQLNGTDEMLRQMLGAAGSRNPFASLQFFGCALFGPAAAEIVAEAESRGVRVRGLYGMSETQALLTLQPEELEFAERMQGGGVPVSGDVEIRARDPQTHQLLTHGQAGEVEIRCPGLMVEYFNDPRATLAVFTADGFLRTGDLGFTRLDGGFVFQSRMGDVLRLGGYLVSPREIEEHLNGHPSVASSQVVGVRIEQKLRAVAFVKMQPGAACAESFLVAHCKQALAGFKVPFRIFSVEEFPTTEGPNGRKVQKHQLRELAQRWCS
jgi:fatty-acyl-CoA synthase